MRTRAILITALLVAATALAAHAQNAVAFRYKYTPGEVETYAAKGDIKGAVTAPDTGPMPITIKGDMRVKVKTLSVSELGVADQEMTWDRMAISGETMGMKMEVLLDNGQLTATANGAPVQGSSGLDLLQKPVKARVDTRGRVLSVSVSGMGQLLAGLDPSTMRQLAVFPEAALSPGGTWSQSVKLPLTVGDQTLDVTVKYDYTFVGVEQYQGATVARITFKGAGQARGPSAAQLLDSITQSVSGYELFDYSAGRSPFARVHLEQVVATRGGQGEPPANMTVKGDFDIARQ